MTPEPSWAVAHQRAVEAGALGYLDPATGFFVMTELAHLARGSCCGNACRHCPYEHAKVDPDRLVIVAPPVERDGR